MEKKEINLNEINEVYDSVKELYLCYCDEMEEKKKELDSLDIKRKELEKFLSYIEEQYNSDTYVFSPRGIAGKTNVSHIEGKHDIGKVIDNSVKQSKQNEFEFLKEKQNNLNLDIEKLKNNISVLERNNALLKKIVNNMPQDTKKETPDGANIFEQFITIYQNDLYHIDKRIRDDSLQILLYLLHMTDLCSQFVDSDPARAKLELNDFNVKIQQVIEQLREVSDRFLIIKSGRNNFSYAINQIISRVKENSPEIVVDVQVDEFEKTENEFTYVLMLKTIMELCLNVSQHSSAKNMFLSLKNKENVYEIMIKDNGIGFDSEIALKNHHCGGFAAVQSYIKFLNGSLDFKSCKDVGTEILVSVPKGVKY